MYIHCIFLMHQSDWTKQNQNFSNAIALMSFTVGRAVVPSIKVKLHTIFQKVKWWKKRGVWKREEREKGETSKRKAQRRGTTRETVGDRPRPTRPRERQINRTWDETNKYKSEKALPQLGYAQRGDSLGRIHTGLVWFQPNQNNLWCRTFRAGVNTNHRLWSDQTVGLGLGCFQTNPGAARLWCESNRTSVRFSSTKHAPLWA